MDFLKKFFDFEKFWIRMNEMDFEGQLLAEKLYRIILVIFTIIAIIVSYITQRLCHGVYILCFGLVLSLLLCLPSWPMYNRHQLKWLKYVPQDKEKDE